MITQPPPPPNDNKKKIHLKGNLNFKGKKIKNETASKRQKIPYHLSHLLHFGHPGQEGDCYHQMTKKERPNQKHLSQAFKVPPDSEKKQTQNPLNAQSFGPT